MSFLLHQCKRLVIFHFFFSKSLINSRDVADYIYIYMFAETGNVLMSRKFRFRKVRSLIPNCKQYKKEVIAGKWKNTFCIGLQFTLGWFANKWPSLSGLNLSFKWLPKRQSARLTQFFFRVVEMLPMGYYVYDTSK